MVPALDAVQVWYKMKESESQTGLYTARAGVVSTAFVAFPAGAVPFPLVKVTGKDAVVEQSRFFALPSALKVRGWKMWPPNPVRGPPGTEVECQTLVTAPFAGFVRGRTPST